MKITTQKIIKGLTVGLLASLMAFQLATPAQAQSREHRHRTTTTRRTSVTRTSHRGTTVTRSTHYYPGRTRTTTTVQRRSYPTRTRSTTVYTRHPSTWTQRTRSTTWSQRNRPNWNRTRTRTTWTSQRNTWHGSTSYRTQRFRPIIHHRYRTSEWRSYHPGWNGHLYFRSGTYYYDDAYDYPAIVDNEWSGIAASFGGVTIALESDPTLYFSGTYGDLYPYDELEVDLHSGNREHRLRGAYFSRPYFWRNGQRFDRVTVDRDGRHYYRFVRRS